MGKASTRTRVDEQDAVLGVSRIGHDIHATSLAHVQAGIRLCKTGVTLW